MARFRIRIGFHQQRQAVAVQCVGDPHLAAVYHILIAIPSRDTANRLEVGAGVGLGQRDTTAQSTLGHQGQELLLLLFSAKTLDRGRHNQVGIENTSGRHPRRGNFLHDTRIGGRG